MMKSAAIAALALLMGVLFGSPDRLSAEGDHSAPIERADLSPAQAETARRIKSEVMAPCCWHGTVDSHNSPVAEKIAAEIELQVARGQSKEQILDALSTTYGERILARPRTSGFGLFFYVGPAIAVGGAGLLLSRWLKRNSKRTSELTSTEKPAGPAPSDAPKIDTAWDQRFEDELKSL